MEKRSYFSIIIFIVMAITCSLFIAGCKQKKPSQTYSTKVLVLDDYAKDKYSKTSTDGDVVLMLNSKSALLKKITGFQVKENLGENKAISVSEDGRFFAVCETAASRLSIYETSTGQEYWTRTWPEKAVNSVMFYKDTLYALNHESVFAIDINKKNIREIEGINGIDFAFDEKNNYIWAGGLDIRKYTLDFKPVLQIETAFDRTKAAVFSVDIASDGSAWFAVREAAELSGIENKLVKISQEGNILDSIRLKIMPYCICVDKSDDSLWITGMKIGKDYSKVGDEWPETLTELNKIIKTDAIACTLKFDSYGQQAASLDKGGYSIVIDPSDKSVWVACLDSIVHISSSGDIISEYKDVSKRHKWITILK